MDPVAESAAETVRGARALVVTAGAGLGVDSGLPDFRGTEGFWKAYPLYQKIGLSFVDAANPTHFDHDPAFGWGFYGHRLELYRKTEPHRGFSLLRRWAEALQLELFVVTSNVDGQFQKAGFAEAQVYEVHGSIHALQCTGPCTGAIWPNREPVPVDVATMRALVIPRCPDCGAPARPNLLMFGDSRWLSTHSDEQSARFERFLAGIAPDRLAVIELGAGMAIATIRHLSEALGRRGARVIRINPREPEIEPPHLSLACGALEGLSRIDEAIGLA